MPTPAFGLIGSSFRHPDWWWRTARDAGMYGLMTFPFDVTTFVYVYVRKRVVVAGVMTTRSVTTSAPILFHDNAVPTRRCQGG